MRPITFPLYAVTVRDIKCPTFTVEGDALQWLSKHIGLLARSRYMLYVEEVVCHHISDHMMA